jgi:putative membrane protein
MLFTTAKFIHLLSLLLLVASSITKNILVRKALVSADIVGKCRAADRVSGATAGLMIVSGIGMLYLSPKGYSFYSGNGLFWLKITLLIVASVFIVRTKIFFRNPINSQQIGGINVPGAIKGILVFDLMSLFAMAALGVLIVKGTMVKF